MFTTCTFLRLEHWLENRLFQRSPQCCISFVDIRLVSLEQKTTFQRYYFSVYGEVALFIDWRALDFMFLFNNRCEGKHRCNIIMYRNIV